MSIKAIIGLSALASTVISQVVTEKGFKNKSRAIIENADTYKEGMGLVAVFMVSVVAGKYRIPAMAAWAVLNHSLAMYNRERARQILNSEQALDSSENYAKAMGDQFRAVAKEAVASIKGVTAQINGVASKAQKESSVNIHLDTEELMKNMKELMSEEEFQALTEALAQNQTAV